MRFLLVLVAVALNDPVTAFCPSSRATHHDLFVTHRESCHHHKRGQLLLRHVTSKENTSVDPKPDPASIAKDLITPNEAAASKGTQKSISVSDDDAQTNRVLSLMANGIPLFKVVNSTLLSKEEEPEVHPLLDFGFYRRRRSSWTRSRFVKRLSSLAFDACDKDRSGRIDKDDFYVGLLLVHLNLAKYVGVAACHPPNREEIDELFELADHDRSGDLNREEFIDAVVVCCTRITSRIVIYYSAIVMAIPFLVGRATVPLQQLSTLPRPLLGRFMYAAKWVVKHFISLALFSIIVPTLFNQIDKHSRGLVKPRKNPRMWWQPQQKKKE